MSNLELLHPLWLLILPLPFLVHWLAPHYTTKRTAIKMPFFHDINQQLDAKLDKGVMVAKPLFWQRAVLIIGWLLIVMALSKPMLLGSPQVRQEYGRDVMVVVDLSGSMGTKDFTNAQGELNVPVKVSEHGNLGVVWGAVSLIDLEKLGYYELAEKSYSFGEAIPAGSTKAWTTLTNYIKQMKKIFNPSTGAYKGLGGFISIGSIFPAEFSWQSFWNITAFLSIMLGFMNLLPIPALDGGHVVFTLWEMITGKKPGDKFLEYAQLVGFVLLIVLLLFANGNDIFRLFK